MNYFSRLRLPNQSLTSNRICWELMWKSNTPNFEIGWGVETTWFDPSDLSILPITYVRRNPPVWRHITTPQNGENGWEIMRKARKISHGDQGRDMIKHVLHEPSTSRTQMPTSDIEALEIAERLTRSHYYRHIKLVEHFQNRKLFHFQKLAYCKSCCLLQVQSNRF